MAALTSSVVRPVNARTRRRPGGAGPRVIASLAVLILALGSAPGPAAEAPVSSEHDIKAAFLFKFPTYVEWPAESFQDPASPLVIGVAGAAEIAAALATYATGRTVNRRPVVVKPLTPGAPLTGLHVLFVGHDAGATLSSLVRAADGLPLLTVTDVDDGLESGCIINFVISERRVRFEISLAAAVQNGLQLSSRLLTVARAVVRRER